MKKLRDATFFTKGKLEQVAALVASHNHGNALDLVVLNSTRLSPRQMHALEKRWRVPVIDRFALILAIFESRAKSREAMLQASSCCPPRPTLQPPPHSCLRCGCLGTMA